MHDVSGVSAPLDLTIANENAVSWGEGYLSIDSAALVSSGAAASKVIDASQASEEITLEAIASEVVECMPSFGGEVVVNHFRNRFINRNDRDAHTAASSISTRNGLG